MLKLRLACMHFDLLLAENKYRAHFDDRAFSYEFAGEDTTT